MKTTRIPEYELLALRTKLSLMRALVERMVNTAIPPSAAKGEAWRQAAFKVMERIEKVDDKAYDIRSKNA